ncbi:MAG: LptF/LptG family permease [Deltaproteobacteria bacterium]|nr:LptF/LptG family permease [Deltaproteobacteria bacterium]
MIARALARDVAASFVLALTGGASLLTLIQSVRLAPVAAAARASGGEWLLAIGLSLVVAAEAIAPAAFAFAVVLTALRWQAGGEILAARAAGLGGFRLWSGALRTAAGAGVVVAALSLAAVPAAMRQLERLLGDLVPRALVGAIRPGALVEVVPGVSIYAGDRRPDGALDDVLVATEDTVLAAASARAYLAGPMSLVLDARRGELRRGPIAMRFERLTLPLDLMGAARSRLAALPRAPRTSFTAWRRASSPVSFLLVAHQLSAAAVELARRPGWLTVLAILLVGMREVAIRAAEESQGRLGAPVAAWMPVAILLPIVSCGLAVARIRGTGR